jgi:hypothetical protein
MAIAYRKAGSERVGWLGAGIQPTAFSWSKPKLRRAALVLATAATLAVVGFLASGQILKWFFLAWLLGVALLMSALSRRTDADAAVLAIDERGILDSRIMSRRLAWQEIEAICPVDLDRSYVVDLRLRSPATTLSGTRWSVRIGALCQKGYGVPAVTISMLLLDGRAADCLAAVARYRPDLLDPANRAALR